MDNLKKIGLTALGTVLVASSAQAADFSMSATSKITYTGADNGDDGNTWSMSDSISFSSTGEMDNGYTITHGIELDGSAGVDALSIGNATIFLQRAKRKIRELAYNFDTDGYTAPDLTILAAVSYTHLTLPTILRV